MVCVLGPLHESGNESTNPREQPESTVSSCTARVESRRERCFNETSNLLTIVILLLSRQFDHY